MFARAELSMVVPEQTVEMPVDSGELFNMGLDSEAAQGMQAGDKRPPFYHSERLVFDFAYRTPLGAEIRQRYRWYPNLQPSTDETLTWTLVRVAVLPDPANEQDIIDVQLAN